jgi:hypothetical protein
MENGSMEFREWHGEIGPRSFFFISFKFGYNPLNNEWQFIFLQMWAAKEIEKKLPNKKNPLIIFCMVSPYDQNNS